MQSLLSIGHFQACFSKQIQFEIQHFLHVQQNGSPITKHTQQKKCPKKCPRYGNRYLEKKKGVEFIRILNSSIFSQHCRESNGKMCHCKESVLLISASAVVNMGEKTACFFFARWLDSPLWSVHIWPWSALFQQGGELRGVSYCMLTDAQSSEAAAFSKSHYKALTSTYPVKKWSRFSTIQYSIHDE